MYVLFERNGDGFVLLRDVDLHCFGNFSAVGSGFLFQDARKEFYAGIGEQYDQHEHTDHINGDVTGIDFSSVKHVSLSSCFQSMPMWTK